MEEPQPQPETATEEVHHLVPRSPLFAITQHVLHLGGLSTTIRARHQISAGETIVAAGGQVYDVAPDGSLRRQDRARGLSKKKRIRLRRMAAGETR